MGESTHASKPCISVSSIAAISAVAGLRNSASRTIGISPITGPTYGIMLVMPYSVDINIPYGRSSASIIIKHSMPTTSDSSMRPTRYFENIKSKSWVN